MHIGTAMELAIAQQSFHCGQRLCLPCPALSRCAFKINSFGIGPLSPSSQFYVDSGVGSLSSSVVSHPWCGISHEASYKSLGAVYTHWVCFLYVAYGGYSAYENGSVYGFAHLRSMGSRGLGWLSLFHVFISLATTEDDPLRWLARVKFVHRRLSLGFARWFLFLFHLHDFRRCRHGFGIIRTGVLGMVTSSHRFNGGIHFGAGVTRHTPSAFTYDSE